MTKSNSSTKRRKVDITRFQTLDDFIVEESARSPGFAKRLKELETLDLNLRAVRQLAGKTQVETAKAADMAQAEISALESRTDHLVSTLRRYVEALGGQLEVVARFGDKSLRLKDV